MASLAWAIAVYEARRVSDVATNESAINFKWEKQGERTKPKTSALTPLKEQRCERHVHKCQWTSALKHPELKPDRHSRVQMTRQYYSDEPAQSWVMFLSLRLSPLPCRSPFSFAVQWSENIPPLKVDGFLGGCQDLRSLVFSSCPEQNCATFSGMGRGTLHRFSPCSISSFPYWAPWAAHTQGTLPLLSLIVFFFSTSLMAPPFHIHFSSLCGNTLCL